MKKLLSQLIGISLFILPTIVHAEDALGTIKEINENDSTLTLNDNKTYTLPGEFDYTVLHPGMRVLVFYDIDHGRRYINGIEPQDA